MRELRAALIPDDENGQVLRRMLEEGDDLGRARPIDFFHVFAEAADARAFAAAASGLPDLVVGAPEVDEEGIWEVCATRTMAPSHAAITALEGSLAQLAAEHRGYPDGWGCMQVQDGD